MLKNRIIREALNNPSRDNFVRLNSFFYNKNLKDETVEDSKTLKCIAKVYNLTLPKKSTEIDIRWRRMIQEYAYKNPGAIKYDYISDRGNTYLDIFHGHGLLIENVRNYNISPVFLFNMELEYFKKYDLILRMFATDNFILPNTKEDFNIYMYLAMVAEKFRDFSVLERIPPKIMLRIMFRLKRPFFIDFIMTKISCYVVKLPPVRAVEYFVKVICSSIIFNNENFTQIVLTIYTNYMRSHHSILMSTEFMTIYTTARRYYNKYVTNFIEENIFSIELNYIDMLLQSYHSAEEMSHFYFLKNEIIEQTKITRYYYHSGQIKEIDSSFPVENLRLFHVESHPTDNDTESNYIMLIWLALNRPDSITIHLIKIGQWQDDLNILIILARYGNLETVKKIINILRPHELHLVYLISRIFAFHDPNSEIYKTVQNFNILFSVHAAYVLHLPELANDIMFKCKFLRSGNYVTSNTRCRKYAITYNDIRMYKYLISLYNSLNFDLVDDLIFAANLGRYNFYIFIRQLLGPDFKATEEMLNRIDKNAGFNDLALLK